MNRFAPGYRQLVRVFTRLDRRCRLFFARRKLARLETELGLLGWQQADYSEETERQVGRLSDFEREQGRLTNESGELAIEIRELRERRARKTAEFAERNSTFKDNLSQLSRPVRGLERRLAARRKALSDAARVVAELETKLAEAGSKGAVANSPTAEERAERLRFDWRFREIPNKLKNARAKVAGIKEEIQCDETDLNVNVPVLKALDDRFRENRARFDAEDGALQREITTRERAKRKLEKEINTLEKAKSHPYREIGRVLADSEVAPMNQPHALENVRAERGHIQSLEAFIAGSLAESRAEPREALLNSWQWWVAVAGALVMLAILTTVAMKIMHFLRG